jgi:hypothetical protein
MKALLKACGMALAITAALLAAPAAQAGRNCDAKKPSVQTITRGLTLAERTLAALDASGAQVVVLARAGQDLGKYGVRYSHLGFAYKTPDGWRVLHKLNQCGTAHGALYRQGLGEFFLDDLWRYEAAWVVPPPSCSSKLIALLRDERRAAPAPQALQPGQLRLGPAVPAVQPVGDRDPGRRHGARRASARREPRPG